jgi:hypothetical protein
MLPLRRAILAAAMPPMPISRWSPEAHASTFVLARRGISALGATSGVLAQRGRGPVSPSTARAAYSRLRLGSID